MRQVLDTRYHTIEPLGSGGMAEVYLAHDEVLNRNVALKVLSRRYADDDALVERFRSEARSAASLSHPNIVSIYDRGETGDGTYYIVMEYVPGGTLKDWILRKGPLPSRTAAAVAIQVAEALEEAHRNGVIHRDIKPQNILITESGDVKVADFGIARAASVSAMTETGWILGTVHYVSPEQAMGKPVGPQSDLYSLGIVLYEMLTGEVPYDAENPLGIAMQHVDGHLRPPREVDPSISEGINAITVRLLAKDPEDRYPDAASLLEDLDRVEQGLAPTAATTQTLATTTRAMDAGRFSTREIPIETPTSHLHRKEKRQRKIFPWILAVVVLLAALALTETMGLNLWQNLQEQTEAPVIEAPSLIEVPDVVGQSFEEASGTLQDAGLTVDQERRTEESDKPEGTVLRTDPQAGSQVEAGTSVTLTVSRGTPKAKTVELNTPTNSSAPKVAATEVNIQQPLPAPAPSPDPAPESAPQQPAPVQSVQDEEQQQVLQNRKDPQERAQEVQERAQELRDRAQERAQEALERARGDGPDN